MKEKREERERDLVPQNATVNHMLKGVRMILTKDASAWVALDSSVSDPSAQQCLQQTKGNLCAHIAGHRKNCIKVN